jgi:hypothetical protein
MRPLHRAEWHGALCDKLLLNWRLREIVQQR